MATKLTGKQIKDGLDATLKAIREAQTFGALAIIVATVTGRNLLGDSYASIVTNNYGKPLADWQVAIFSAAQDRIAELWPAFDEAAAQAKVAASDAKAAQHFQDREDSFNRCDTDGFLSQWASGLSGQRDREQARLDAQGGFDTFRALFDAETGEEVDAVVIDGAYGPSWLLKQGRVSRKTGKRFVPVYAANAATVFQHGYVEGVVVAPARATITGRGKGLSGNAWVTTYRER